LQALLPGHCLAWILLPVSATMGFSLDSRPARGLGTATERAMLHLPSPRRPDLAARRRTLRSRVVLTTPRGKSPCCTGAVRIAVAALVLALAGPTAVRGAGPGDPTPSSRAAPTAQGSAAPTKDRASRPPEVREASPVGGA